MKQSLLLFFLLLIIGILPAFSQEPQVSEHKKLRYLRRLEKKNARYVKQEEKKTRKLVHTLAAKENRLISAADSARPDSMLRGVRFSQLDERLPGEYSALSKTFSGKALPALSLSSIPANADGRIQDYLKQQITTTSFLNDTACKTCAKLKKQEAKAQKSIAETAKKLDYLKSVQNKIKQHEEELKSYYGNTPECLKQIEGMEKSCFYFNQGMSGFKSLYTMPSFGIERSLLHSLSFSKSYTGFASQFGTQIPGLQSLSGGGVPDMSGFQTRAQVQAMLPQNTPGISLAQKAQLESNMTNSLSQFFKQRNKHPDVSALKDKPAFKTNPYKGLPLRQRLVFSKDIQMHGKNKYLPSTADLGVSIGFKLTERITPLAGIGYKLGMGNNIQNIHFSDQGLIARSGFDTKLAYGFSLQCLFEETWNSAQIFLNEGTSHNPEPSFIVGLMTKHQIGRKTNSTFFIGYDFLYMQHTPPSSPLVIRAGWQ